MPDFPILLILIIALAIIFDFINGFHDAANAIATVVSTKVLTPFQAVTWAAFFNTSIVALIIAPHISLNKGAAMPEPSNSNMENMPKGSSDASLPVVPNDATAEVKTLDVSDRF